MQRTPTYGRNISYVGIRWRYTLWCEHPFNNKLLWLLLCIMVTLVERRVKYISAETQSGLPLLPWSCYASVIQCDIIQYLLFLFYYNTGIISFLAIYNDTILCTIFCVSERLYAKKTLFLTCYDVALLFWVFCKHVCFNVHE